MSSQNFVKRVESGDCLLYDNVMLACLRDDRVILPFRPKLIVAGTSAYSRLIDYKRFRAIADKQVHILVMPTSLC